MQEVAEEIAQWLKALNSLAEDPLVPGIHVMPHNHVQL